jgi:hypothetical protein
MIPDEAKCQISSRMEKMLSNEEYLTRLALAIKQLDLTESAGEC